MQSRIQTVTALIETTAEDGGGGNGILHDVVVGVIVGLIVAFVVGTAAALYKVIRRRATQRRERRQRVGRLTTGVQLSVITETLGKPPAIRRAVTVMRDAAVEREETFDKCIYADGTDYVGALVDGDETVQLVTVTTRSEEFQPRFESAPVGNVPRLDVRLCDTTFAESGAEPETFDAYRGAQHFGYAEVYYLGRPGFYRHYVCAVNDAGALCHDVRADDLFGAGPGGSKLFLRRGSAADDPSWPRVNGFRSRTRINTWTVADVSLAPTPGATPLLYGVDAEDVRALP